MKRSRQEKSISPDLSKVTNKNKKGFILYTLLHDGGPDPTAHEKKILTIVL